MDLRDGTDTSVKLAYDQVQFIWLVSASCACGASLDQDMRRHCNSCYHSLFLTNDWMQAYKAAQASQQHETIVWTEPVTVLRTWWSFTNQNKDKVEDMRPYHRHAV